MIYYKPVKLKLISALIFAGLAWSSLLGASGGILLHLHDAGHDRHAEHADSHGCETESTEDCCLEDAHILLEAEELPELRINESVAIKAPAVDFALLGSLFSPVDDVLLPPFSLNPNNCKRGPPASSAVSVVLKTVVLRV